MTTSTLREIDSRYIDRGQGIEVKSSSATRTTGQSS